MEFKKNMNKETKNIIKINKNSLTAYRSSCNAATVLESKTRLASYTLIIEPINTIFEFTFPFNQIVLI